jgi:transposase-like protein
MILTYQPVHFPPSQTKLFPLVKEWQDRPLEAIYCIVWLDAMLYGVKEDGHVKNRCVYNILGINAKGR